MSYSVYGNHQRKMPNSTFIKLYNKRGAAKGLGHSTTGKNNFDRRHSVTTQSSSEKGYSCTAGERSVPQQSRSQPQPHSHYSHECNGFKGQFDYTEQRYNYERISQQQQKRQFQQWPSEPVSMCYIFNSRIPSCTSDQVDGGDPAMLIQRNAVNSQFLALREFRIKNSNECYGHGQLDELPLQLPGNFVQLSTNQYPRELTTGNPSLPMPYALRQSLLRNELARDFSNRIARKDFINSGLNKSLALSYQPMY